MRHLGVQLQLDQSLLSRRLRQQGNALEILAQPREEVLHLEVGELLAQTNAWTVIERDKLPFVGGLPCFYTILVGFRRNDTGQ